MTTTATAQAPTLPAPDADALLTWGSWKTHGRPERFFYYGHDRKTPASNGEVVTAELASSGTLLVFRNQDGKRVAGGGVATRFWAVPAAEKTEVRHYSDGDSIAVTQVPQPRQESQPTADAKAIQRAARPGRNAKLHDCLCGCKGQVKGMYKQGHDARHAADVAAKAIAAGTDADLTKILAELPTEALRIKAAAIVRKVVK